MDVKQFCENDRIIYSIALSLGIVSIICCVAVVVYLFRNGLYEKQKFLQIIYLNSVTVIAILGFVTIIASRTLFHIERLGCLLSFSIFGFSGDFPLLSSESHV